jgi:hypothetical protein
MANGTNKSMIIGKVCPHCGGRYNLRCLPRTATNDPYRFHCGWCKREGLTSELKDEHPLRRARNM